MIDTGSGAAVVMIPGIQGRWEWMSPAIDSLADTCRVITGSLAGDRGSIGVIDPEAGFESHVTWVDALLDRAGLTETALCGVSYGGLIALHYAACRPKRVRALVLVSAPAPTWTPDWRVEWYLKAPRLFSPVFALSSPFRLYPELVAAFPNLAKRGSFGIRHLHRVTRHPFAPTRMAQRARLLAGVDFVADCRRIEVPTMVVTGEQSLDRVVPVESTREYLDAIPGARYEQLDGTGHLGLITAPDRFCRVVGSFVVAHNVRGAAPQRIPA